MKSSASSVLSSSLRAFFAAAAVSFDYGKNGALNRFAHGLERHFGRASEAGIKRRGGNALFLEAFESLAQAAQNLRRNNAGMCRGRP